MNQKEKGKQMVRFSISVLVLLVFVFFSVYFFVLGKSTLGFLTLAFVVCAGFSGAYYGYQIYKSR